MVAGMSGAMITGWDMGAALAMARALGVDAALAAEVLPEIEAIMVRKANERMAAGDRSSLGSER